MTKKEIYICYAILFIDVLMFICFILSAYNLYKYKQCYNNSFIFSWCKAYKNF